MNNLEKEKGRIGEKEKERYQIWLERRRWEQQQPWNW